MGPRERIVRATPPTAPARGFVLVGVVMFVLALTILGLSLYAISGYEGQFLSDTQAEEQALFRAEGGMALAQALLQVPPYSLAQSHYAEGYEGIVRATAWQIKNSLPDSTGSLDWSKNVFLRISTRVGSQTKVVEQEFAPQQRYSPYRRLFTARVIEYTPRDGSNRPRTNSAHLNGPRQAVWQYVRNSADTSWVRDLYWDSGRPMLTVETPSPDVAGYFSSNFAGADSAAYPDNSGGEHRVLLDAGSDVATRAFRNPRIAPNAANLDLADCYGFYCTSELKVEVRGTCVWMAPDGIRFDNRVTFKRASGANANPTLIIVTGPNGRDLNFGDYRDVGLWFFDDGVTVEGGVRVIIVSSGHVRLEVAEQGGGGGGGFAHPGGMDPPGGGGGGGGGSYEFTLPFLNIFADHITMMGPRPQDGRMDLTYNVVMDALIDDLVSRGVLPVANGVAAGGFTPVADSWRTP